MEKEIDLLEKNVNTKDENIKRIESLHNEVKNTKYIIAIRAEQKSKWERRAALTPDAVKELVEMGIRVLVEPSLSRCFTDKQYQDAGAELSEDISEASVIFGVKEVPNNLLIPNKTYLYFSHTFKGQSNNMSNLNEILKKNIRLIDYELIKENKIENAQRLVAFGRFAGVVGAIDILQGVGDFLINKSIYTPFLHTGFSYMFSDLIEAKARIQHIGEMIQKQGFNKKILPVVFAVTGNGRVAKGAMEILELLPHEKIDPDDLYTLFKSDYSPSNIVSNKKVYITIFDHKHLYKRKNCDEKFDKEHFYKNKKDYISLFSKKYLPFLSVLFHCMYWDTDSPVIITENDAKYLSEMNMLRLLAITDITCDYPISSIELLKKLTCIEKPFYLIDPITGRIEDDYSNISRNSILYHSVDHLPSEMPFDSTRIFSEKLKGFVKDILESDYPSEYDENNSTLTPEIYNACQTWNGKLCKKYEYLYKDLALQFDEYKEYLK